MSSIALGDTRSKLAGEDLSSAQYLFVTLETDDQLDLADATTDNAYGILQNAPESGQECDVIARGESKVVAAETLAVNVIIAPDADGKAQTASLGQYPRGIVTQAAGAPDDIAVVHLFQSSEALGGADEFSSVTVTGIIAIASAALTLSDAVDLVFGTTTGTEIGKAANQKLAFHGATPVVQQAHVADPTAQAAMTASDPDACDSVTFTHSWNGSTDPSAGEGAALITDLGAMKTAIDANNTAIDAAIDDLGEIDGAVDNNKAAIDSILATLEAYGLHATS